MAVTAFPYGKFLLALGSGDINVVSDTLKILLTTVDYVPNIDTDEFLSDVTDEVTGTGYTAGGITLTNKTWTYDDAANRSVLTADPVTWSGVTLTAHIAVVYVSTGVPTTSRLVGYIDFGEDKSYVSEDFEISFPSGVLRLRVL